MAVPGWNGRYLGIVREFGYSRQLDYEAGIILDSVLGRTVPDHVLARLISGKTVFVAGAGDSLGTAISVLKRFRGTVTIAADSAAKPMVECGIVPDIVVTDLDGDVDSLRRCSKGGSILVVHAHGDNIPRLHLATGFGRCLGTTQSKPYGAVRNFGGFTDGDRSVFLASHFGAGRIVLLGMDYDGRVGRYSGTEKADRKTKLKKLDKSRELLGWLSERTSSGLFTTSSPIPGFQRVRYGDLDKII